ncbi:MAG: hypothetical protein ACK5N9_12915 [Pirellula sp.]|jgi:hypothetical protein
MRLNFRTRNCLTFLMAGLLGAASFSGMSQALGKDFFVVIGGGFSPESNQASLEANLIFFQDVLAVRGLAKSRQFYYFADGDDSSADLQVVASKQKSEHELIELMRGIHRQDFDEVEYRNHKVPQVDGRSSPENVKQCLSKIAAEAAAGDRVIVYITAHGGSGARKSPYNTTVMGWNRSSFSVSDFSEWLSDIPAEVSCVSIMAQCYCGGFADAIFERGNEKNGLAPRLQVGFFAQQHNLPAAGCRPDIENDEEFSSYFWGAMVGRSRTGEPFVGVDDNEDGKVSFAEAYAYTVIASRTIDIPLRASDRLLRVYSSLDPSIPIGQQNEVSEESSELKEESGDVGTMEDDDADDIPVKPARRSAVVLSGAIPELLRDSNQTTRRIAMALMKQLDVPEGADVSEVYRLQDELDAEDRASGGRGRSRWRSGRRQLLSLIGSRWEKLADRDQWRDYVVQLPAEECDSIFKEIQNLDGFGDYKKIREEARARIEKSQAKELQQVAFKRLIHHLELAVLEKNLPSCAIEEIQARYHAMVELENQSL